MIRSIVSNNKWCYTFWWALKSYLHHYRKNESGNPVLDWNGPSILSTVLKRRVQSNYFIGVCMISVSNRCCRKLMSRDEWKQIATKNCFQYSEFLVKVTCQRIIFGVTSDICSYWRGHFFSRSFCFRWFCFPLLLQHWVHSETRKVKLVKSGKAKACAAEIPVKKRQWETKVCHTLQNV